MDKISQSKLSWYIDRLKAMSLAEIGYRLQQSVLIEQERFAGKNSSNDLNRSTIESNNFSKFRCEQEGKFFFSWREKEKAQEFYSHNFLEETESLKVSANEILEHRLTLFRKKFELGMDINWWRDPLTRRVWPGRFWSEIDIRDGRTIGGVKWVWELNRHHHLVTLGKAYYLFDEEEYAEEVCAQMENWIRANPVYYGVNWISPLELAVRIINWTWALSFIKDSQSLTLGRYLRFEQSITEQCAHIERHLSRYSSANNHLIGEAAGLTLVGLSFPWLDPGSRWQKRGIRVLTGEFGKQIYPDGVPAEQAVHYHLFDLDFMLFVLRLAQINNVKVPQVWYDRLASACDFICRLMDEANNVPSIGDSDDAWVVKLDDRPKVNNCLSILASATALLQRPDFKAICGRWDEKSHWLLGEEGFESFKSTSVGDRVSGSKVFDAGGYCVMGGPKSVLVFDCGPLGYLSTAAHGHADALSLCLSLSGKQLLVDPGTYAYQEGGPWRDFFRGTSAHNTILIDDQDQSEMRGTFLWSRKATSNLQYWISTENYDLAIGEHSGYNHLGIKHQRSVFFIKPDCVLVVDRLSGKGMHTFEQNWHLSAECEVTFQEGNVNITADNSKISIVPIIHSQRKTSVRMGQKNPIQGWTSDYYGDLKPAPVISTTGKAQFPLELRTIIYFPQSLGKVNPKNILNDFETIIQDVGIKDLL
jgi:hypothetical protein